MANPSEEPIVPDAPAQPDDTTDPDTAVGEFIPDPLVAEEDQ